MKLDKLLDYLWQASPWNKDRIKKEVIKAIKSEIRLKEVPFDDDRDMSERARLREMHQLGYNQAVTDLNKIINNI